MHLPRKLALTALASVAVAGLAGASAASLGNLTSQGVGSGDSVVAACDQDGMTIAYTTAYNGTAQRYDVTGITFSGVNAACGTKSFDLTLRDSAGATTSQSGTVALTGSTWDLSLSQAVAAEGLTGLTLVITG